MCAVTGAPPGPILDESLPIHGKEGISTCTGVEQRHRLTAGVVTHPRGGEEGGCSEVGEERAAGAEEQHAAEERGFAVGHPAEALGVRVGQAP